MAVKLQLERHSGMYTGLLDAANLTPPIGHIFAGSAIMAKIGPDFHGVLRKDEWP